jgi:hypothetical protein
MAVETYEEQVGKLKDGTINDFDRMTLQKPQKPKVPYEMEGMTIYDVVLEQLK